MDQINGIITRFTPTYISSANPSFASPRPAPGVRPSTPLAQTKWAASLCHERMDLQRSNQRSNQSGQKFVLRSVRSV